MAYSDTDVPYACRVSKLRSFGRLGLDSTLGFLFGEHSGDSVYVSI